MSYKNIRTSLMDVFHKKKDKAKTFLNKFKHQRHLSSSLPLVPHSISNKELLSKREKVESDKTPPQIEKSLEEISSYDTNKKSKINNGKDTPKKRTKSIAPLNEKEVKEKDSETIEKNSRSRSKSKKNTLLKTPMKKISKIYEKEKYKEKKEIIVRKCSDFDEVPQHSLILPSELKDQLEKPELYIVSPNQNVEGNYSSYINGVAATLKEFIEFDYDSIFDQKNKENVRYCYHTNFLVDLEDEIPKKKLLLIDLDETLIHSEFRNKNNYKELDLFTRTSKCQSRTFSYSDENYIYYMDVFFRPHLKHFLSEVSKYFDLAIFTAAMKGYADIIIDFIDPNNSIFKFRLYREACIPIQDRLYIKDLRIIKDYDPMNVILMDNSLYSFMNQPSNGMLVNSFYTSHKDTQLISAKNFLINHIYPCEDVRKECEKWYHFTKLFYKGTSKEIKESEK